MAFVDSSSPPASPTHKDGAMPVLAVSMLGPRDEVVDELEELKTKVAELSTSNRVLRAENRALQTKNRDLQNKNGALGRALATLKTSVKTSVAAFVRNERRDLAALRTSVTALAKEHALASKTAVSVARKKDAARDGALRAEAAARSEQAAARDAKIAVLQQDLMTTETELDDRVADLVRTKVALATDLTEHERAKHERRSAGGVT